MECRACFSENMIAKVVVVVDMPCTKRGNSVKVGGTTLSGVQAKQQFESQEGMNWALYTAGADNHQEDQILGPIFCEDCKTEHFYVKGSKENPFVGSFLDARKAGPEKFKGGKK